MPRHTAIILALFSVGCPLPLVAGDVYDARIKEQEILTPTPAAAPRLNGPVLSGATPGKLFLHRIPTQGEHRIELGRIRRLLHLLRLRRLAAEGPR